MHRQICDLSRENTVSVRMAERKWTSLRTGSQRGRKKKSGERSEPLSAKKRIPQIALPLDSSPFRSRLSPLALDHTWLVRTKPINPTGSLFPGYKWTDNLNSDSQFTCYKIS